MFEVYDMADEQVKIRTCQVDGCKKRMSSIEKDRHLLCPVHIGWQCNWEQRCNICKEWPDQQMRDYMRLQEGKARKKAHKDKQKALKAANRSSDSHAHSLSPSSVSSNDLGEIVSTYFVDQLGNKNFGDGNVNINIDDRFSDISCSPSANPPPLGTAQLGLGSVVPCGSNLASLGNVDPAPLMVAGENPTHTGQPPQTLTPREIAEGFKTPSVSGMSRTSRRSSISKLTPEAYSVLRGVLNDHKLASDEELMNIMFKTLREKDKSFSGSLSSSRSVRSSVSKSETGKRPEREKETVASVKSTDIERRISLTEQLGVVPVAHSSKTKQEFSAPQPLNKVELSREWAQMVVKGGVTVNAGFSYFYKDKAGLENFVVPPTESRSGGVDFGAAVRVYGLFSCFGIFSLWRRRLGDCETGCAIPGVGRGQR